MNWRAGYELKPARQAKRKEADATGPQGGYGIRLALSHIEQKRCQRFSFDPVFVALWDHNLSIAQKHINFK